MDNNIKFNQSSLYSILPDISSLSDYCDFKEKSQCITNTQFEPMSIDLFIFVSYNMSLRKLNFKQKVQDLKSFVIVLNNIYKPSNNNSNDLNSIEDINFLIKSQSRIIINYIDSFIAIISETAFNVNDDSNKSSLFQLLLLSYDIKQHNISIISGTALYSIELLITMVNNKINPQEKANDTTSSSNHENELNAIKTDKKMFQKIYSDNDSITRNKYRKKKCHNLFHHSDKYIHHHQYCSMIKILNKKLTKLMSNNNKQVTLRNKKKKTIRKTVSQKQTLKSLCQESYKIQTNNANFFPSDFYSDNEYKIQMIGSNTFGLNTLEFHLDFIITPSYFRHIIYLDDIISWITCAPIKNILFTLENQYIDRYDNKPVLYMKGVVLTSGDWFSANIYIAKTKYLRCNELLKILFPKNSTLAKMHIFLTPILKLSSGAKLAFLILAFFKQRYKIFTDKRRNVTCLFCIKKDANTFYIENREFWYYKLNKANYNKAGKRHIGTLIQEFITFYYNLHLQHEEKYSFSSKMGYLLRSSYMFPIFRIIKNFKYTSKEYWSKINDCHTKLINGQFNSYSDLIHYLK